MYPRPGSGVERQGEVCQARSVQLSAGRAEAHCGCSADLGNNESFEPYTRNLLVRRVLSRDVVSPNGLAAISKG
eukprot:1956622-Heterocapsa_arctica.AAC.1